MLILDIDIRTGNNIHDLRSRVHTAGAFPDRNNLGMCLGNPRGLQGCEEE